MTPALEPCPFCGGGVVAAAELDNALWIEHVEPGCLVFDGGIWASEYEWNHRTHGEASEVEELRKQRLMILAAVYGEAPRFVATICDEKLDRSGKLLGEVRELARAALSDRSKQEE